MPTWFPSLRLQSLSRSLHQSLRSLYQSLRRLLVLRQLEVQLHLT